MILTVSLNPLLEKTLFFENIKNSEVNRASSVLINAGGKGINVSRQLNYLSIDNLATGFLGGDSGKRLKSILYKENIKNSFLQIKSETREGFVVVRNQIEQTSFFEPDPLITRNEVDEFIERTKRSILNSEMVIFSGSAPTNPAGEDCTRIFTELISYGNENDKFTIVDTYGQNLSSIYSAKPKIAHANIKEIETSLGKSLVTEVNVLSFLRSKEIEGIKIFILTDGEKPFFAMNQKYLYRIEPMKVDAVNPTGSGDAFMAGLIFGLHNNLPFEEILKFATVCGSLNASMMEVCRVPQDEIEKNLSLVKVHKLN
ncbi:MAG: 1-phosphofructokinase family hexose kinase [Bacteroidetes bacterium]|nr:1-phosphofructokinase family hexose kinase [Bacteroidota bacterium]MBU2584960.1 1-phosphofructokinase family hexose kinase [Bacteroidota bacterium]